MNERIKLLRQQLGITQAEFANKIGVNPSTISVWERDGKVPDLKVNEICKTFGVNKDWLLTGKGNSNTPNDKELFKETVNRRIRLLRKRLGLTQTQFAARLKVNMPTIIKWERYDPISDSIIESLVDAFNINEKWLRDGVGEMFAKTDDITKQYETAREFALRHGCDEVTSLVFERFMELPDSEKKMFGNFLALLLTQKVRDAADKGIGVSTDDPTNIYRDVYTINNTTFNQKENNE